MTLIIETDASIANQMKKGHLRRNALVRENKEAFIVLLGCGKTVLNQDLWYASVPASVSSKSQESVFWSTMLYFYMLQSYEKNKMLLIAKTLWNILC